MKRMTITEFVERFNNGEFAASDYHTQRKAGWYDWFCKTNRLASRLKVLGKAVASIKDSRRFVKDACYVFFKNNFPCVGPMYDQFSICDMATGDVMYCVQHLAKGSHGCKKAHWEVLGVENDFKEPLATGTWNDCKKWFNENKQISMANEVTNFMLYMTNKWSKEEAKLLFGDDLGMHVFKKWEQQLTLHRGDLLWYAGLDNACRQKVVDRANELYNKKS